MEPKNKTALIVTLIALGLYLSGFLIYVTPLPFIYYQLKYPKEPFTRLAWPAVFAVTLLYVFGTQFFYSIYQANPEMAWMLPVPLVGLVEFFSAPIVTVLGIFYFGIYVVLVSSNEILFFLHSHFPPTLLNEENLIY